MKVYITSEKALLGIQDDIRQKTVSITVPENVFNNCPDVIEVEKLKLDYEPVSTIYLVKSGESAKVVRYLIDNSKTDKLQYKKQEA